MMGFVSVFFKNNLHQIVILSIILFFVMHSLAKKKSAYKKEDKEIIFYAFCYSIVFLATPYALVLLAGMRNIILIKYLCKYGSQFFLLFLLILFVKKNHINLSVCIGINVSYKIWYGLFYRVAISILLLHAVLNMASMPAVTQYDFFNNIMSSTKYFLLEFTAAVLVAPILEEIFYRGFLYDTFKKYFPWGLAYILVSLSWVVLHPIKMYIPLLLISFLSLYLVDKTASIIPAILIHGLVNLLSLSNELIAYCFTIELLKSRAFVQPIFCVAMITLIEVIRRLISRERNVAHLRT